MRNTMKKIKMWPMMLLLAIFFVSCEKEKKEWSLDYGFSTEDVVGSYSNSNVKGAFDGLAESAYCRICYDAEVAITNVGGKSRFELKSPNIGFNVSIQGSPVSNGDGFLLQMSQSPNELTAYVYTNNASQVRLHGFVRKWKNSDESINYYFDVIKN